MEAYNETNFRDISTNIEELENNWLVNVSVYFANNTRKVINGTIQFDILDFKSSDEISISANVQGEFVYEKSFSLPKVSTFTIFYHQKNMKRIFEIFS